MLHTFKKITLEKMRKTKEIKKLRKSETDRIELTESGGNKFTVVTEPVILNYKWTVEKQKHMG